MWYGISSLSVLPSWVSHHLMCILLIRGESQPTSTLSFYIRERALLEFYM